MFFGSYIFEFIGVVVRFLIQFLMHFFNDKKNKTFKELWDGPDTEDPLNSISHGLVNIIIGFTVLMIFVILSLYVF